MRRSSSQCCVRLPPVRAEEVVGGALVPAVRVGQAATARRLVVHQRARRVVAQHLHRVDFVVAVRRRRVEREAEAAQQLRPGRLHRGPARSFPGPTP
jgi:hypothetical protein